MEIVKMSQAELEKLSLILGESIEEVKNIINNVLGGEAILVVEEES